MRLNSIFVFLFILASTQFSWAHGEDKLGPHGGYVRMPGAFHIEVSIQQKTLFVYLLDMAWKNPTIQASSIQVQLKDRGEVKTLSCVANVDHFTCPWPSNKDTKRGQLVVSGHRGTYPPGTATYQLPLQLYKANDVHK